MFYLTDVDYHRQAQVTFGVLLFIMADHISQVIGSNRSQTPMTHNLPCCCSTSMYYEHRLYLIAHARDCSCVVCQSCRCMQMPRTAVAQLAIKINIQQIYACQMILPNERIGVGKMPKSRLLGKVLHLTA